MLSLMLALQMPEFDKFWNYGQTVVLFGLIFLFILRSLPTWKEVRLREIELRGDDNKTRGETAAALGLLAQALTANSKTLEVIAVEQRRATEIIEILQRANADSSDTLSHNVRMLVDRIGEIEDSGGTTLAQLAVNLHRLTQKVDSIAGPQRTSNMEGQHVESETATTRT